MVDMPLVSRLRVPDDYFGQVLPQVLDRVVVVDQCRNKCSKLLGAGIVLSDGGQGGNAARSIVVRVGVDEGLEHDDVRVAKPAPGVLEMGAGIEAA